MKVSVLGTDYDISFSDVKDADGYTDFTTKKIVIGHITKDNGYEWGNLAEHRRRVIRHEVVHAFMYESGLCHNSKWGRDETLIDWIAIQAPKMFEAFDKAMYPEMDTL